MNGNTHSTVLLLLFLLVGAWACNEPVEVAPTFADDAEWMMAHTDAYLHDRAWRRTQMEDSLWMPELPYAKKRIHNYALEQGGWDLLPEFDVAVVPVNGPLADSETFQGTRLAPSDTPQTLEQWRALGELVFWTMPMRPDAYIEWVIAHPELWDELGFETDEAGNLRGLTRYRDPLGRVRVGMACGLCHGSGGVAGNANPNLNLGLARSMHQEVLGREPGVFGTWGAGRVDVTNDDIVNPLAIKNLWGVPHQSHLNSSGSIAVQNPASLAVRFETQYIEGHALAARPNRTLIWALTLYVLGIESPQSAPDYDMPGAAVFQERCAGCHDPSRGFSGDLIAAEMLTSNPSSALSPTRGTGFYKTPSLVGISATAPYLHDGSLPTLTDLLDSGHPTGESALHQKQQQDLFDFLQTL